MNGRVKFVMAWALAVALSALLARMHPFGDAGLYAEPAVEGPLLEHSSAPAEVKTLLMAKCGDCHSSVTNAPLYGHFAPMSWLIDRDIVAGRKAMNLSEWDRYTAEQQQTFIAKMVQKTKAREMPLPQYRLIHWNANVTDADVEALRRWAHEAPVAAAPATAAEGDAALGKLLFEKRCTGCHALTQDREGPRLAGVYGRAAGTVHGFGYSAALAGSHIAWSDSTLDRWLADTDALVPGNNMDFRVPKAQERKDLIAFLRGGGA